MRLAYPLRSSLALFRYGSCSRARSHQHQIMLIHGAPCRGDLYKIYPIGKCSELGSSFITILQPI